MLMSKLVAATALCLCLLLGDRALADGSVSQTRMGMGSGPAGFRPFDALVSQYNASGEQFRIDRHCQSACTLFLAIRNVCITPSASLLFHAGHTLGPTKAIKAGATAHMLAAYNSKLQAYLNAGHYMDTLAFHTISGRDMIAKFGYRACK
jgi:hypothetical protein